MPRLASLTDGMGYGIYCQNLGFTFSMRRLKTFTVFGVNEETKLTTSVRPSFETIYINLASQLARRSTCKRLKVGTVITSTDYRKVLAVGYNGNASGLTNSCDRDEPGNCGCLHSEENAVINCDALRSVEKHVFVTHLPCVMCAKRLINLGNVRKVFYAESYRVTDSIDVLTKLGIDVSQVSPE